MADQHSIPVSVDARLREIAPYDLFPSVIDFEEEISDELEALINASMLRKEDAFIDWRMRSLLEIGA